MSAPFRHPRRGSLLLGVTAVSLALLLGIWGIRGRSSDEPSREQYAIGTDSANGPVGPVRFVRGNPGWAELSAEDRERAATPLSGAARNWLARNGPVVHQVAAAFGTSAVALGGLVAAEQTLLMGRVDALGERVFAAVFGAVRPGDLDRWVADQERTFQRRAAAGEQPGRGTVRNPYLWTLGPAQVSFRLAVRAEPALAAAQNRPERSPKEVFTALTTTRGNLEYAALLLVEAERAYRRIAGLEIGGNPGVLATLYHLGAPTARAERIADETTTRRARGLSPDPPQVNFYGAFVNIHAREIAALLDPNAPR
ncbi:MAG: DUF1402 family protein [Gemmatimonadota bacterium]